ncbi:MAG: UDP-N-acetylmuramate--L-alanine ligase [Bacteroidetes bacterium]|nr:UDP-N-acetylmuramate--L-alanine ligase [Bacteroidota bacterium]
MELQSVNKVYFLGIGGIGMSALARHFLAKGVSVFGYDKTPSEITNSLINEGAEVHFTDSPELIPGNIDLIIYTPAIPKELNEFILLKDSGKPFYKRAEILGMLAEGKKTIAVAGTHGKTTVSTIIAHIFKTANINFSAFLGGISANYNSNYITNGDCEWVVAEADEFDRSFLNLHPDIAVITAIDADHLDIYKSKENLIESFRLFAQNIKPKGTLIIKNGLDTPLGYKEKLINYHSCNQSDIYAQNIVIESGKYFSDFAGLIEGSNIHLGLPGKHNLENALAASTVSFCIGIKPELIFNALSTFKGVKRRFEICYNKNNTVYIDDYAHHPEEIKACINAARELYPNKKITGVFQPHLYSRTKDFANDFAKSLSNLDELVMLDIYPAREKPIDGVSSEIILKDVSIKDKSIITKQNLIDFLKTKDIELLLTMGAGDIDRFTEQIKAMLESRGK